MYINMNININLFRMMNESHNQSSLYPAGNIYSSKKGTRLNIFKEQNFYDKQFYHL